MASLFGSLFGRAEKKSEESFQPVPPKTQKYDQEYIDYCIELEQTVSALEAYLHTSDDPKEIAMETLKTACRFYGGDWAGILDVDLELDVWSPPWWYNLRSYDRTMMLFQEFEIAKFMPNWVRSLDEGSPIIITDAKAVRSEYPQEYEVYKRLEVESVIGVPFGPNPVGFLAIRNPTRYIERPSMMSILAYVLHRAMAQQKTIDSAKMTLSLDEIQSDKDIIINFFGSMALYTSAGVLHERDFNSPKSSRVATYLMLNRKSAHSPLEIVEALWPESEDKWETLSTYIRGYVRTFRKAFSLISPYQLIESTANGYQINHDFRIMTDLQQFDLLWEQAQHAVTIPHKVDLLKQAVALYKGPVFENACDEHWIIGTVTHYKMRYIGIVNELLVTLDQAEDYTGVQQYWFDFEHGGGSIQNGRRPAIIIQADSFNENNPTTVVAPITSVHKCRHLPSHIFIGDEFGLAQPSMILLEQIRTINQDSLGSYIGIVDDEDLLNAISNGLKKTFSLWYYRSAKSDVRCLCRRCLREYMDTHNYFINRLDPFQKVKDSCDRCGRAGYDYTLKEKNRKA